MQIQHLFQICLFLWYHFLSPNLHMSLSEKCFYQNLMNNLKQQNQIIIIQNCGFHRPKLLKYLSPFIHKFCWFHFMILYQYDEVFFYLSVNEQFIYIRFAVTFSNRNL